MTFRACVIAVSVAGAALASQGSQASAFNLTDTVTWKSGPTGSVTDNNPFATVNSVVPTVSFGLSNAFNQLVSSGSPLANEFPSPSVTADPGGVAGHWNFYDNYVFSLNSGSTIQSALISFTMPGGSPAGGLIGISNLEARIVRLGASPNPSYTNGNYDAIAGTAAQLGNSAVAIVDGWTGTQTSFPGGSDYYSVLLNQKQFASGLYGLQIRGLVGSSNQGGTDLFSGSYGGNISFTAVPLPAGVWLLGSGLLGLLLRKRATVNQGVDLNAPAW